jgi:hypothetical protein
MSDEVLIPYGEDASKTATLLLGAAEDKGYEPFVVRHQPDDAGFRVPPDVAKAAGLDAADTEAAEAEAETQRRKQIEVINAEQGVDASGQPISADDAAKVIADSSDAKAADKPLTPKQQSMARAEELGLSTKGTKAQIDKRIKAAEKK